MNALDNFISEIKENALFPALLNKIEATRPTIPEFNFLSDNSDEWKAKSGMRSGYDLFAALLKIKLGD